MISGISSDSLGLVSASIEDALDNWARGVDRPGGTEGLERWSPRGYMLLLDGLVRDLRAEAFDARRSNGLLEAAIDVELDRLDAVTADRRGSSRGGRRLADTIADGGAL